ncbi:tigger transposable element-derived protein 4 [Trichonephila clavipes]|nr:tigger transposable element-derived protein 4 [Trichonephila clavipes]
MRQCRGQNIPMNSSLLKKKAKAFAKELGIEFSASEGWLTNFKKRNGIVFKKMCGKSSSVDINVCSEWQNSLSDLIKECEPRNIFNTDETGLFFKCLPEKTFIFTKEKCHGGKHSKERLTILHAGRLRKGYSSRHRKICKTSVFQGHKLVPYQIPLKLEGMDDHRTP